MFARKGFAATTVRDIAAEAGILSGSLYHHFTSKNELFEEIIRTAVDADLARDAATAGASDFDAETALRSMVDRMLRNMATNPDVARILSTGLDGVHGTGAHTILQRRRQAMRASLTTILERGVQDGSFRPDLDVDLAYRMIVSSVDGLGRWFVPAGARSIEDVSADLTRMLLDAVRRTPSRRSRASADRS